MIIPLLSFSCLACAFVAVGLGTWVYARNPRSPETRLFFLSMALAAYWAVGEFLIWQVRTPESMAWYLKASAFWPMVIAVFFHFVVVYTDHPLGRKENSWVLALGVYAPSLSLSLLGLLTGELYAVAYREGVGYVYVPVAGSLANALESGYILAVMVTAFAIVFLSWRTEKRGREAYQKRLVGTGILAVTVTGALSGLVLPRLGIYTPNLVFVGIAAFSVGIAHAIRARGLFSLTPEATMPHILSVIPDGILLADMRGEIRSANAAARRILELPGGDPAGSGIGDCIGEKCAEDVTATLLRDGKFSDMEAEVGRTRYAVVSLSGARVDDPEGLPVGMVIAVRDISERKARETALRIANEKTSLLTRLTRHDLNNLVTVLYGYLELMRSDCGQYIDAALVTVQKISEHLAFSQQYQDVGSAHPRWQPLGEIIGRAKDEARPENLEFSVDVPDVDVYADGLVYRVIYALIDNTLRHAGGATEVRIHAESREDNVLDIVFEDNGRGIEEGDKEAIFAYGFGKHTGLGLALSRDILSLTALSIRETGVFGEGARFVISVPAHAWRRR